MATLDLSSPLAKLNRAYEHLDALHEQTIAFYAGELTDGPPYVINSEFRADSSQYVFTIKTLNEPPPLLGLILGDFAHNLRSALDHLVCQLARLTDPTCDCTTTEYPICWSSARFKERENSLLKGVRREHRAIIEEHQPYTAGEKADDHFLSILHWLDNVDKHRFVHPTFGYMVDMGFEAARAVRFIPNADAGPIRGHSFARGRRIEGDTDIAWLTIEPTGPNPKVEMHGEPSFEPAIGDLWLRARVLPELVESVKSIIALFAAG
ncbi:MAG: hypothetical protein WAN93_10845 [Solirubrobacteraceae bacterium]